LERLRKNKKLGIGFGRGVENNGKECDNRKKVLSSINDINNEIEKEGFTTPYMSQKRDRTQKAMMGMRSGTRGKGMFRLSAKSRRIG